MRVARPGAKELIATSPRVQQMCAFLVANQHKIAETERGMITFNFAGSSIKGQFQETFTLG